MKISKLFHWLYFIVMMLPIFSIPIFAIYSHRHTIDSYSVQVQETIAVDFNQVRASEHISGSFVGDVTQYQTVEVTTFDFHIGHKYLSRLNYSLQAGISVQFRLGNPSYAGYSFYLNSTLNHLDYIGEYVLSPVDYNNNIMYFQCFASGSLNLSYYDLNVFDLTQMFGEGNEPTIEQFNIWYPNDYYEYNTGTKELLNTGNYLTYNDTDIGSQFTYDVYNVVDKYFNYDNVFNFKDLYSWLNLTFFNGGASLGFFIFWHLLIYWLLTSILWLIFDVLMYVPQLVHRWLDKASLS